MKIVEKTPFTEIQITLTTVEEVTQLYSILNFAPVFDIMNSGEVDWLELRKVLSKHQVNYYPWFNRFVKEWKGEGK